MHVVKVVGKSTKYSVINAYPNQLSQTVKDLPAVRETWIRFLCQEDPLEKEMATHSSILAWKVPWTEEPGGYIQSMGSQRVRQTERLN